ncbi:hypothetical protein BS78_09G028100 [Paspalum vaginatum]|nr:hypothetical protein BS78_09G028100 [Paspalum vaginatum]
MRRSVSGQTKSHSLARSLVRAQKGTCCDCMRARTHTATRPANIFLIRSMETAAAALTTTSQRPAAAAASAHHGQRRATTAVLPRRRREPPCARLRALPPELSEILAPKLVPGSPADTGDVSSLIPVSALMLLFYFVSNWVVPEFLMKGLDKPKDDEAGAAATSMSASGDGGDASSRKTRLKVKSKKKRKAAVEV